MTVHTRQFATTLEVRDVSDAGDGRTVYGRIVPYGEVVSFLDHDGAVRRERFVRGAFAKQSGAASRVTLSFEHQEGFQNTVGYGSKLLEQDDGAYATFRLYESDARKVAEMIDTSHGGLSVEFEPRGTRDEVDDQGVIVRRSVHLRRVGITGTPAYSGAEVLAVREASVPGTNHVEDALAFVRAARGGAS